MKLLFIIFIPLLPLIVSSQTLTDSVIIQNTTIRYAVNYTSATYTNGDSISFRSSSTKRRGLVSPLSLPINTLTQTALDTKQATLVSATNIKTVNGNNLLGSGDISISSAVAWGGVTGTLSNQTDLQTALNEKQATITNGSISNAMLANGAVANLSGTNTGDNATNTQYSGLEASKQNTITPGTTAQYLKGDFSLGTYSGYSINVQALTSSPTDAQTIYFGMLPKAPTTTAAISKIYIRQAGTIKRAELYCYSGTAGTNEAWVISIRLNNTTDTQIASVSLGTSERIFSNTALSIAVSAGDYIEIKCVNPTWATNPLTTIFGGYIYIE